MKIYSYTLSAAELTRSVGTRERDPSEPRRVARAFASGIQQHLTKSGAEVGAVSIISGGGRNEALAPRPTSGRPPTNLRGRDNRQAFRPIELRRGHLSVVGPA